MTTLALTFTKAQKKVRKKIDSIDLPIINWRSFCVVLFFFGLATLIFYVVQINSLAKSSYLRNKYLNEITQLSEENKALRVSFAKTDFFESALAKIKQLNFVRVSSVKYIQIPNDSEVIAKANKKF